jgi:hypothetical protein
VVRERSGYWLKIIHAEELLNVIRAEIQLYAEANPYRMIGKFDDDGASYFVRCQLDEEPPMRLPLLIGDCLHNLRSALDHLAWALVEAHGGTPGTTTQFPVRITQFDKKGNQKPPIAIDGGVSHLAWTLIDNVQPYHREDHGEDPRGHPLALVHSLNILDKHKMLALALAGIAGGLVRVRAGNLAFNAGFVGRVDDGAEVARWPYTPPPPGLPGRGVSLDGRSASGCSRHPAHNVQRARPAV